MLQLLSLTILNPAVKQNIRCAAGCRTKCGARIPTQTHAASAPPSMPSHLLGAAGCCSVLAARATRGVGSFARQSCALAEEKVDVRKAHNVIERKLAGMHHELPEETVQCVESDFCSGARVLVTDRSWLPDPVLKIRTGASSRRTSTARVVLANIYLSATTCR